MRVTGALHSRRHDPVAAARRVATLAAVLLVLGVAGLVMAGGLVWKHVRTSRQVVALAQDRARTETGRTAAALDVMLAGIVPLADQAARDLGRETFSADALTQRLETWAAPNRVASGLGVAYEPFAFDRGRRLFAPYVTVQPDRQRRQIADAYDYTKFEHRWYGDPLLDGAMWNEPLRGPAGTSPQAMYAVPFTAPGRDAAKDGPSGVVFATIALDKIQQALDTMALGTSGYAFVFSSQGHYAAHPRRDLVAQATTVFETAWTAGDTALHSLAIHSLKGETGLVESIDPTTGQASWIAYSPIKTSGWTLAVVYFADAFRLDDDTTRRDYFHVTAAAAGGVGLIGLGLFTTFVAGHPRRLWAVAATMSVVLAGGIATLWWVADRFPAAEDVDRTVVFDAVGAEAYLQDAEREAAHPYARIPTGIFVKSIEFLSSSNIAVTGYIWQRLAAPAPVVPQFLLPEADKPEIKEVSRTRVGKDEVVLWYVAATLRKRFDYEKYPFDRQDIWVRLRPPISGPPAVFVPDLTAYTLLNPAVRPGVASDLVLPGWRLTGSFFDFRRTPLNTDFGAQTGVTEAVPELYFNVTASRLFLGPFVANLVPLGVAGLMIFSLLLISSKSEGSKYGGFTAKDIIKGSAAVFFVISYQHIALRNALTAPRLIYFEYFYFTTYLGLLSVMMNAIFFAASWGGSILEFRDNLLPKVAFWPTAMTCLFVVTMFVFY